MTQFSRESIRPIAIIPAEAALGAEVRCGRLQSIDDTIFGEIRQAWLDNLVLLFRDQTLSDAQFLEFGRRFGPLKSAAAADRHNELHIVSNVHVDGLPIGIQGHGEIVWHSDMVSFSKPPAASLLHAIVIPPSGGDTSFSNMYVAYDTLPKSLKRKLAGLTLKHEVSPNSAESGTGASHPLVCTHPDTGCNALFLGSRFNTCINELPRHESDILLEFLWLHATQPEFVWRHRWRVGDLVVWDNRCLLHRREAFASNARRILLRTQVEAGEPPRIAADALERPVHRRGLALIGR
ncbi:MAG: TauD/TfdA family dioxygenase [Propionivibrio sp.]|nr:TauD/TfdA family dioxygenase [Propionivibrio sp.]